MIDAIGTIISTIADAFDTVKTYIASFKDTVTMVFNLLPSPFKEMLLGLLAVILVVLIAKLLGVLK